MDLKYELFGGLRVLRNGTEVTVKSRLRRKALVALLLDVGRPVTTDRLIDSIWGDDPPTSRGGALLFHISKLRDDLEPDRASGGSGVLETTPIGYRLAASPDDVDIFRWSRAVDDAAGRISHDPVGALRTLEALCREYLEPVPEFAYDDFWLPTTRDLQRQLAMAERMRVDALIAVGRDDDAIAELRRLHESDPYDEAVVARLVMALYRGGHQAEALRTFDRTRQRLIEELGVDPGPELQTAHLRVLQQDPELTGVRTASPELRHNLPAEPTALLGRDEDLARLEEAARSSRLVTITGIPGIGKSRLARAWVRANLDSFESGALLLDMATLPPAASLDEELAAALSVVTRELVAPANAVATAAGLDMLVLIDNASGSGVAPLIHRLLAGSRCRVIVTAQEPLPIEGRSVVLGGLNDEAATALVKTTIGPTGADGAIDWAGLLDRCAGIPTALLQAAAAIRLGAALHAPDTAADRVADIFHNAVEALDDPSRQVLGSLAQFEGTFTLPEAADVAGVDDTVARLGYLMDRGLLRAADDGLELPPPLRLPAIATAPASDEAGERYLRTIASRSSGASLVHLADADKVIRILARSDMERAEELLARLMPWLWQTHRHQLATSWSRIVLTGRPLPATPAVERATFYAAHTAASMGDTELASDLSTLHATVADQLGEPMTIYALLTQADMAWFRGEVAGAARLYGAAEREARRLGHPEEVTALFGSGIVAASTGKYELAAEVADHLLAVGSRHSLQWVAHVAAELLGLAALGERRLDAAVSHFTHARESSRAVDRITAGRRLVRAYLLADAMSEAESAWESLLAELRSAGTPPHAPIHYTGALLFDASGDEASRDRLLDEGGRSVVASPAALWVAFALAATASVSPNDQRRAAAARLVAAHLAATGLRLLPPFDRIDPDASGEEIDPVAVARLLAPIEPTTG